MTAVAEPPNSASWLANELGVDRLTLIGGSMTLSISDDIATALNREDFRQWLVRIGAGEAGIPRDSARCPTARYLNASTGHAIRVFNSNTHTDDLTETLTNPEWLQSFIRCVDLHSSHEPITALKCLEILDAIPA